MIPINRNPNYSEGSPWFWKIFGSAIIGLISILLLSHITSINSSIDRYSSSLRVEIKDVYNTVDVLKQKIVTLEQIKEQSREKQEELIKSINELKISLEESKTKITANEVQFSSVKDEINLLRDSNKELIKELQTLRDKIVAADAIQKVSK